MSGEILIPIQWKHPGVSGSFATASNWSSKSSITTPGPFSVMDLPASSSPYVVTENATTAGAAEVVTGSRAELDITGGTFDVGLNVTNQGYIDVGPNAKFVSEGPLNNTSYIEANGGSIVAEGTVTGSGWATISGAGKITFNAASSNNVYFEPGASGTLVLKDPSQFTGTVGGSLNPSDRIDIGSLPWMSGHMTDIYLGNSAGGTLIISNGTQSVDIKLSGNFLGSTWFGGSDGSGGTIIEDPPAGTSSAAGAVGAPGLSQLTQAMASFGAPAAGSGLSATAAVFDHAAQSNLAVNAHHA